MAEVRLHNVLGYLRRLSRPTGIDALSDSQILERVLRQRDEAAFEVLVWRYGPMVLGTCRKLLAREQDAEDAFQATFLALMRRAGSIRTGQALPGWLYQVACRAALRARARTARRQSLERDQVDLAGYCGQGDERATAERRELQAVLSEELGRLPARYRTPLICCYLEGKTHEQAARELNWPLGSLSRHLARGKELLRGRLTRRGVALSVGTIGSLLAEEASASLTASLVLPTVSAALEFAATGVTTIPAAKLACGVLRSMWMSKVKSLVAILFAIGLLSAGAGVIARKGLAEQPIEASLEVDSDQPQVEHSPKPVATRPERFDQWGDPLPPGAIARMGTVRFRHGSPVYGVAYSRDGKAIVASSHNDVYFWDAASGRTLRRFKGFLASARPLFYHLGFAISPDETCVAAAATTWNGRVQIWHIASEKKLLEWDTPTKQFITGIAYAPDGQTLATVERNGVLRLWNPATGAEIRALSESCCSIMAFAPDSRIIAYGHQDHSIRLCELATGKELARCAGHPDCAGVLCFSPDGKVLGSVMMNYSRGKVKDDAVRLWDVRTGVELRRLKGRRDNESPIAFSPDGKTLATVDHGEIILSDPATGEERLKFKGHSQGDLKGVNALAFSPDSKTLASGGNDQTVRQWDASTGKPLQQTGGHQDRVHVIAFSPDNRLVATASEDQTLRFWEVQTGRELHKIETAELMGESGILGTELHFSPDGRKLFANCHPQSPKHNATIACWDVSTGTELLRFKERKGRGAASLALSADGKLLAAAELPLRDALFPFGSAVTVWDTTTGQELRQMSEVQGMVIHVHFLGQSQTIQGGGVDPATSKTRFQYWDARTGKRIRQQEGFSVTEEGRLQAIALSSDSRMLALATFEKKGNDFETVIQVKSPVTGQEIRTFRRPWRRCDGLAFSPDCRTLASLEADGTIYRWELATSKERRAFPGHRGGGRALVFSADGSLLASGAHDTSVMIWDVADRMAAKKTPLPARELEACWLALRGNDALQAEQAIHTLVAASKQSLPLFRELIRRTKAADADRVARLVVDLDNNQFAVRQQATAELGKLGESAVPGLRKALKASPSLELRRRIEQFLDKEAQTTANPAGERLRLLRALEALEQMRSPEAQELLTSLSEGMPESWLTVEAKAVLERCTLASSASP
jgi:RNA polymerase sigma factor (sigma-70 family)